MKNSLPSTDRPSTQAQPLRAGAAAVDISPTTPQHLAGYPHVPRMSTGVHDPLYSSALYLDNGKKSLLFVANDALYVTKDMGAWARKRIEESTGVRTDRIMLTSTHTHSAPATRPGTIPYDRPVPDPEYLKQYENGIVDAAVSAFKAARPAEIGFSVARIEGVGTNRRSPDRAADPDAPVLMVRDAETRKPIAVMVVYAMHPTVLHEDSKLASADFPGMARQYLQREILGADCPVLHHTGAAGNQSPRHCVRGQTFDEAERLGTRFGKAVAEAVKDLSFQNRITLDTRRTEIADLPVRDFPDVEEAEAKLKQVQDKFARQKADGTPRAIVRTTECDVFGAEATLRKAHAVVEGNLQKGLAECLPAEVQAFRVGERIYVGWQGEAFVEFALKLREQCPDTYVVTCANGRLEGYIVTQEAADEAAREGGYEAMNATFSPAAGDALVEAGVKLVAQLARGTR